jgi:tRNA (guanine37-N1)-methyltransferase
MFQGPFDESIVRRAQDRGLLEVHLYNIRDFSNDRHHTVDDAPFGGGPGMVMKPEPLFEAVEAARRDLAAQRGDDVARDAPVVLFTPQGRRLTQGIARELAARPALVLLCGHYQGVDARVEEGLATDAISIGDYVLTGGEIPAMALVDAVTRLLPGALGDDASARDDSFSTGSTGLLAPPLYTRPAQYRGLGVPPMLLSGDHAAVDRWRRRQALLRTWQRRPDLLEGASLSEEDRVLLEDLEREGPGFLEQGPP